MRNRPLKHVFLVDDAPRILSALSESLKGIPVNVTCFNDAESCIDELKTSNCHLLITDMNMPGINGLELLKAVKRMRPLLPIILITGYGDIPKAVQAIKNGAYDFIEKPFGEDKIIEIVKIVLEDDIENCFAGRGLTKREKEILKLITQGKSNKEIASILTRSIKTIEYHRYRLMRKLGAHNLADLVRIASDMNLKQ